MGSFSTHSKNSKVRRCRVNADGHVVTKKTSSFYLASDFSFPSPKVMAAPPSRGEERREEVENAFLGKSLPFILKEHPLQVLAIGWSCVRGSS